MAFFWVRPAEPVDAYRFVCDDYLSYLTTAGSCFRGFEEDDRGSSLTDLAYFVFDVFLAGLLCSAAFLVGDLDAYFLIAAGVSVLLSSSIDVSLATRLPLLLYPTAF